MAIARVHAADIATKRGRTYRSTPLVVDPQTARLRASVPRSATWSRIRLTVVAAVDGEEFRSSSEFDKADDAGTKGIVETEAWIEYTLPYGFFTPGKVPREQWAQQRVKRLGEAKGQLRVWVEVEALDGDVAAPVELWAETVPPPTTEQLGWKYHESIAYDTASDAQGAYSSSALTVSHTAAGSNRLALVGFSTNDYANLTHTVTYAGNTPTATPIAVRDSGSDTGGNWQRTTLSSFVDAKLSTGAQTVSCTPSTTVTRALGVITLTGVDQTTPTGGAAISGATSGSSYSATATSVGATDLVVDCWGHYQGDPTAGANQTQRIGQFSGDARITISTQAGSDGGAMTQSITSASNEYAGGALAVKEAGAGGGGLSIPVAMAQYRQRWR